jgi:hypothetical protein
MPVFGTLMMMKAEAPQMLWVPKEVFWSWLDRTGVSIDYSGWCFFHATEEELQKRIGTTPPNHDLTAEDDPPGPVSRWYGRLGDVPILLDFHDLSSVGPSVEIYHGRQTHARALVRVFFKSWGRNWQENSIPSNS